MHFSAGNGQPRGTSTVPVVSAHFRSLYKRLWARGVIAELAERKLIYRRQRELTTGVGTGSASASKLTAIDAR